MDRRWQIEERTARLFEQTFGVRAEAVATAPGRVELLGNHTDYNGGLVMSAAIDRFTAVAGRPTAGGAFRIYSAQFEETDVFAFSDLASESTWGTGWTRYVRGTLRGLHEGAAASEVSSFDAVILGDVPVGSGLSSSASLEAAVAAFVDASHLTNDAARMDLARRLQEVENRCVGVACGLLDQFSVILGRAGCALWLDCASGAFGRVPLGDPAPSIVICDSKTSRRLADGMYNRRRAECQRVVAHFRNLRGDTVRWLRDVSLEELAKHWDRLDAVGRRRARHVLTENARVLAGIDALSAGDAAALGRLMNASHDSSRDDFENSSPELDALVEAARAAPGFLGGKLSGAGWAGCTVNLVETEQVEAFAESVLSGYARRTGVSPEIHICRAADGARASEVPEESR